MAKEQQRNKDLDTVLDIIQFGKSIENIYKKLADLEKKGLKDFEEYLKLHSLIEECIKIELNKYKKINNFFSSDIIEIRNLIQDLNRLQEDDLLNIINTFKNSNSLKRFYFRLRDFSLLRNEQPEEELEIEEPKEDYQILEFMGMRFKIPTSQANLLGLGKNKEADEEMRKQDLENARIVNDLIYYKYAYINSIFMDLINEEIEKCKNKNIKNRLIDYKYQLLYMSSTNEAAFAKDPNRFSNTPYYQAIIEHNASYYPDEYSYSYTALLEEETQDCITELSQANYNKSLAKIDEKVKILLQTLYAKANTLAIIDEKSREYIDQVQGAARFASASPDDIENLNKIIAEGKTLSKRKNVD